MEFDPRKVQWQNWRQPDPVKPRGPNLDPIVSELVGKPVLATDPRLAKWAVEKAKKNKSEFQPTRMMEDKLNRRELGEIFGGTVSHNNLHTETTIADKNWKRIHESTRTNKRSKLKRKGKTRRIKNRGSGCHCGKRPRQRRKSVLNSTANVTSTPRTNMVHDTLRESEQTIPGSQEINPGTLA